MYNYVSPNATMRAAGLVAACASTLLKRTNILGNDYSYGLGSVNDNGNVNHNDNGTPSCFIMIVIMI